MKSMLLCNARLTVNIFVAIPSSYVAMHSSLSLDTHISIGGVVIEQFQDSVGALINSSLELAARK